MQVILSGLAIGSIYGLVAMGFALAFYVTRVINFAQGQLLMVTVMVTAALSRAGWPTAVSIALGLAGAVIIGCLTYLVAVRPVLSFDRFGFAWLVSTIGVATILEAAAALIWGPTSRDFPDLLNDHRLSILGAHMSLQEALAVVVAVLAAVAFEVYRRRSLFGKLGVAIAGDPEMASAVGANTTVVAIVAFALAALLSGIAGILVGPVTFANPYLGSTYAIYGFAALMMAGVDRPSGAMCAGLLLGVLSQWADSAINSQASDWLPFALVLVVLVITPNGLFASIRRPGLTLWRSPTPERNRA